MVCNRKDYLAQARVIIVKIGSAVLADKNGLHQATLDSLSDQLSRVRSACPGRQIIVVSSGAVAAGRAMLAADGKPQAGTSRKIRQALAAIGQSTLMRAWTEAFSRYGIVIAQVLLTRDDFHSRVRFQHASDTFAQMLAWNVIPVVNENDTVAVHELQFGDNDTLASLLVNLAGADLFINLTSAAGVRAADPHISPEAPVLEIIDDIGKLDIESLCGSKTSLGSGGMYSKLLAARRVAQLGVPTLILPGREPGALLAAFGLTDESREGLAGTWITPGEQIIPRRKFWLAYQSDPQGVVIVDKGASMALLANGSSLLPGGIVSVAGDFEAGALISIKYADRILGVGFSNYAARTLREIIGKKRHEIAAILGDSKYPDVIHRDNMLLDAAVASRTS